MSIDQLEALLIEREAELAELHARFGDPAVYKDPALFADLQRRMDDLENEVAEVEAAWEDRVDTQ